MRDFISDTALAAKDKKALDERLLILELKLSRVSARFYLACGIAAAAYVLSIVALCLP